jgi:hypothetical protein
MKETINVKSNGLRNELKEIRKSIDALTKAIIASNKQTYEKDYYYRKHRHDDSLRKSKHNDD